MHVQRFHGLQEPLDTLSFPLIFPCEVFGLQCGYSDFMFKCASILCVAAFVALLLQREDQESPPRYISRMHQAPSTHQPDKFTQPPPIQTSSLHELRAFSTDKREELPRILPRVVIPRMSLSSLHHNHQLFIPETCHTRSHVRHLNRLVLSCMLSHG